MNGRQSTPPTAFGELVGDVERPRLEDYARKYKHVFAFERQDGVLVARLHANGDVAGSTGWINVWSQAWWEIGNDPENEVIVITATGEQWVEYPFPREAEITDELRAAIRASGRTDSVHRLYYDALKHTENVIFGLNVPTIGVIQGPAFVHYEPALLCDITIAADDVVMKDPHSELGLAPGDGLGFAYQHLMSPKQQAYYLYTSDSIDAQKAVELGLVNEIMPRDDLILRAREIAQKILRMPPLSRLMAKEIVRREAKRRHVQDAGFHVAHEILGLACNISDGTAHTPEQAAASLDGFDAAKRR